MLGPQGVGGTDFLKARRCCSEQQVCKGADSLQLAEPVCKATSDRHAHILSSSAGLDAYTPLGKHARGWGHSSD